MKTDFPLEPDSDALKWLGARFSHSLILTGMDHRADSVCAVSALLYRCRINPDLNFHHFITLIRGNDSSDY